MFLFIDYNLKRSLLKEKDRSDRLTLVLLLLLRLTVIVTHSQQTTTLKCSL
ncbi:hypothetical protein IQ238_24420 [Pleurocapsales cyanobacterium LEGE 06147]|nr:hypothetical protein [Pleurocapsales cyanobacterium LEGE 06147]